MRCGKRIESTNFKPQVPMPVLSRQMPVLSSVMLALK
jgi:hypothetical protein